MLIETLGRGGRSGLGRCVYLRGRHVAVAAIALPVCDTAVVPGSKTVSGSREEINDATISQRFCRSFAVGKGFGTGGSPRVVPRGTGLQRAHGTPWPQTDTLQGGQHCPGRCFPLPVLALVSEPESGTWMPPICACEVRRPGCPRLRVRGQAPWMPPPPPSARAWSGALSPSRIGVFVGRGVCVLTPLSAVSLWRPRPHRVALFSLRNLSRPGLTQYELDSKSRPVAPSGHALHRDGERGP